MMYLHDFQYMSDTEVYGSKAGNLGKLMFEKYRVPNGVVFRPDAELPNDETIGRVLEWVSEAGHRRPSTFGRAPTYAVRSSGLAEDGEDSSYAGQHDTYLHVKAEDVLEYIHKCRESGTKAKAYREAKGESDKGIAVLVQLMVPSWMSGVTFTSDPFNMDLGTSVIEYTMGLGDKLVAGEVDPTGSHEVDNGTLDFTPPLTEGLGLGFASDDCVIRMGKALRDVHLQCQRIATYFGKPMDIEWAVDSESRLWILQARPLTTGGRTWNYPEFQGTPVVKGRAEGLAVWANAAEPEETHFDEGNILLAVMTNPHMVPLMVKASGIATQIGGRTCHAAIVSRELNKPCVVSIGNLNLLQSRTQVVLDATTGMVQV